MKRKWGKDKVKKYEGERLRQNKVLRNNYIISPLFVRILGKRILSRKREVGIVIYFQNIDIHSSSTLFVTPPP